MTGSERLDPIADLVQEFIRRCSAGEAIEPEEFARTSTGGDDALRQRLLPELRRATAALEPTLALKPAEQRTERVAAGPTAAPSYPETGRRIDNRYVVERQLGEGGFGVVYLVRDEVHGGNLRALKMIRGELTQDSDLAQRFKNEMIVVKALSHRYVPRFHNDGRTPDGDFYYVMDFVDGKRLDDVLRKEGPLKPDRIVRIVRQVLEVLEYAHGKGVFHRDLKPSNILLVKVGTPEEEVRVLDFGIAKILAREGEFAELESMHTLQGGAIGTPHYMAPEQVTGHGRIDGKTDLYALGVIIYQMCSGRVPFTGKTSMEVAAARLTQAPPPLDEETPEWLRLLVMKLLERQKEKRPGTVELRAEFDNLSTGQRALRRTLSWIGAGVVVIALGVAWLLYEGGKPPTIIQQGAIPRPPTGPVLPIAFQSPAEGYRGSSADIDVVVEAKGRHSVKIGDRDVDVRGDGTASARVRVATDAPAAIVVRGEDGSELARRSVYVDTRAPVLAVDLPEGALESAGRWLTSRKELEITGRLDDGEGGLLPEDPVSIAGQVSVEFLPQGGFRARWRLDEGVHELSLRGRDAVGHSASFARTVVVDASDPLITFATLPSATSADRVRVEGVVKDATTCTATLARDGDPSAAGPLALDDQGRFAREMPLAPGTNALVVEARDAVGHVARRTLSIERTRTAAAIAAVQPASGKSVSAADATVRVAATTNLRPSRVEVTRGEQRLEAAFQPSAEGFTIDLPLEFGANVFRLTPYDAEGQAGTPFDVTYVRTPPGVPPGCTVPADVDLDEQGRPLHVVHSRSGLVLVLASGGTRNGTRVAPYYLGRSEVAIHELERWRSAFYAAPESRPSYWDDIAAGRPLHPATRVSFEEAQAICRELGLRLPTTDEWELAAGAGDGRDYPWGTGWKPGACNSDAAGDGFSRTAPVDSFPLDLAPCGAADMAGNVSEWCTSSSGGKPALRGGNWSSAPEACRITAPRNPPAKSSETIGFRVALDAPH